MSTRRPKVPKAASAGDGSNAGGRAAGRIGARPARWRNTAADDPEIISATKPVEDSWEPAAAGTEPAAGKPAAPKPAGKTPAGKTPAVKKPAAAAGTAGTGTPGRASAADRLRKRSLILSTGGDGRGSAGFGFGGSAAEDSDDLRPVPAKAFSGRLLVLAMVMLVVTVLLAPSVNTYLHQRSDIAALEAELADQNETSRKLETLLDRWEDPNYIKQQARERIFLVMPGETRYLVKGEHGVENVEQEAQAQEEDLKWVDALWDSVKKSATAP